MNTNPNLFFVELSKDVSLIEEDSTLTYLPKILCNLLKSRAFLKFSTALVFSLLCLIRSVNAQTNELFPTGSYIINMGITPQTNANALKPYGLIYDLLKNNKIPVKWVISQTKLKDGTDFIYNGVSYKGGTFIIPAQFRNASVNAKITSYGVTGITTTSNLTLSVTNTLTSAPTWTLDATNGAIAETFFTAAGIPTSAYNYQSPNLLDGCDDIFVIPHNDNPNWAEHGNLYNWNRTHRGAIWAGCITVSGLENMNNGTLQTNFLANNVGALGNALVPGATHADPVAPFTHQFPNSPVAQYIGLTDAVHTDGAEQVYLPKKGGGWRPTTQIIAYDPNQSDMPSMSNGPAALIAFGRAFGNNSYGWVMYESSHDINKVKSGTTTTRDTPPSIAAERAFFNFSFLAAVDKVPFIGSIVVPSAVSSRKSYPLSVLATSPVSSALRYAWSSSCGGSFSSISSATPTYTAPVVTTTTTCVITCTITDACGRVTFSANTMVIQPCQDATLAVITAARPSGKYCADAAIQLNAQPTGGTLGITSGPGTLVGNIVNATGVGTIVVNYALPTVGVCSSSASINIQTEGCCLNGATAPILRKY